MEIITKETINKLPNKYYIEGSVYLVDYTPIKKEKTAYIDGSIQTTDGNIAFKVWSNEKAYLQLQDVDYRNTACNVKAEVNLYNGTVSLLLKEVEKSTEYEEDDFFTSSYDIKKMDNELRTILNDNLSERALELIDLMLLENENYDAFCKEYAAKSNHDNCRGGLLAHTLKMLKTLVYMLDIYPNLAFSEDPQEIKDLYIIGVVMHDFGKIKEMKNGVYQPYSNSTHRVFGLEHIFTYRDVIIEKYDEAWYYNLVDIITQHHDEYAEPSSAVASYIVHLIDDIDAQLTKIESRLKNECCENSTGKFIEVDDKKLYL